jgi:2Fe-2S ferredoxin
MPKVTFIQHNGIEHHCEGEVGKSIMLIAVDNGVPGILADCGGSATCGTCHGYLDMRWTERAPIPTEQEATVLDGLLEIKANSRLTCQLLMTSELDGIVISLPSCQI